MNYTQAQVGTACRAYGPSVSVAGLLDANGAPLDGVRLLWAIAGEESSFGANCGPRLEPGYWDGEESRSGLQSMLNAQWGAAAAKSYGPWQVMYQNCARFGSPSEIDSNIDLACQAAVAFLNNYVIKSQKAESLLEIARIYNSGNQIVPMTLGVMRYVENVCNFYTRTEIA